MFSSIASHILDLPAWVALLVVFVVPALESSAFVGFIFPGELALILGGVLASQGKAPLAAVILAGIAGAVAGDSVGYGFGRRYGRGLLNSTVGRFIDHRHLDRAVHYLADRGGPAVFFGRFTAALRVMIPGLAGMSGLRYRTFLAYNVASALIWGTMSVLFGYLGGNGWRHVERVASGVGLAALGVAVLVATTAWLRHRRRQPPHQPPSPRRPAMTAPIHPQRTSLQRTVVVIPTYNEADNIVRVIDEVRAAAPAADILVVDDNSPDGTAHLVATHPGRAATGRETPGCVHLMQRREKSGLGDAYRAGFAWAQARNYDVIAQMDADLSHPPGRIPALLEALATGEGADIAIGSRYVPGGDVSGWSWSRRLISWAGNVYVRLVLGLPVQDTTAGFKAFRADALLTIGVTTSSSNGYCFQIENTWRAVRLGLRLVEVPITFTDRTAGTSKMSHAIVVEALGRVLAWRWDEVLHGHPPAASIETEVDVTQPGLDAAAGPGPGHVAA